jgi:hypothetical protein
MASTWTTISGKGLRGAFGKEKSIPTYLQFVPGNVVDVVTSSENLRYAGGNTINSIIALPHISNKIFNRRSSIGKEQYRYYPLLRGITDVPTKGDPVLLCTIGKINYYLGPLNTTDNSPTWNDDPSYQPESTLGLYNNSANSSIESLNFNKDILYKRLEKFNNPILDYLGTSIHETPGDTMLEGRHGNSIRIGSRSNNPYIFISNGRNPNNILEGPGDGSLITITSNGSLRNHLGGTTLINQSGESEFTPFTLASDTVFENKRLMGNTYATVNNLEDSTEPIYAYGGNQILFNSDRITLNTKLDDIYLSSKKDIHIGTGRHLTLSINKNFVIESEKLYFGNPNKQDNKDKMEPLVLGQQLFDILKELTDLLAETNALVQGVPVPLTDATGGPGTFKAKVTPISQKLNTILSQYYFFEPNKGTEQ